MAKLEIRRKEQKEKLGRYGSEGFRFSDYEILIDGNEPSHITNLNLNMSADGFNQVTMTFFVDELIVDAEAVMALQAIVERDKEQGGERE